jgi:cell division septal protein FtsQ
MSRTNQNLSRAERVRMRRMEQTAHRLTLTQKTVYRPETVFLPVTPRPGRQARPPQGKGARRKHYDIAFSMGRTNVRTPGIALPQFGPRVISAVLCAALLFGLYTFLAAPTFQVGGAEIGGNLRLGVDEINAALRLAGKSIFHAVPAQIAANLLNDYPDLASAEVHVAFPNRVIVNVSERTPLIAWYQDGTLWWIDEEGMNFPPRSQAAGSLINVVASDAPPQVQPAAESAEADAAASIQKLPFLDPAMVQAILSLSAFVPGGGSLVYDALYGLGWEDLRGWKVYFGSNTEDIPMKLSIYSAIVDTLIEKGIQPKLISVERLGAPFYK